MTMPQGSTEEPFINEVGRESIPVHVVSTTARPSKNIGTEFGRWQTVTVSNTAGAFSATPGSMRLLSRSLRRKRANIFVIPTVAGQPTTDGVIVGSREEINSGVPATPGFLGGFLPIGTSVRYEVQQELWVCFPSTNTDSVYVTTCDELYASDPESFREEAR